MAFGVISVSVQGKPVVSSAPRSSLEVGGRRRTLGSVAPRLDGRRRPLSVSTPRALRRLILAGAGVSVVELMERMEAYTSEVTAEVLVVRAKVGEEEDEVLVFRGFSSSLVRPTPDDLSDPVLPEGTEITGVDRVKAPYNYAGDQVVVEGDLSVEQVEALLTTNGF